MDPAVHAIPIALAAALCMAAAPAAAQNEAPAAVDTVTAGVEVWPHAVGRLGEAAGAAPVVDYRLWLGAGRASFGVGLAAATPVQRDLDGGPWLAGNSASSMMVGLRYQLSERSRLYVDTASLHDGLAERDVRMGFEFKSARSTALGIARGSLLRVQWTSRSQVSLRLRGGGLAVALRAQFY